MRPQRPVPHDQRVIDVKKYVHPLPTFRRPRNILSLRTYLISIIHTRCTGLSGRNTNLLPHIQELETPAAFVLPRALVGPSLSFLASHIDDVQGQLADHQFGAAYLSARVVLATTTDFAVKLHCGLSFRDRDAQLAALVRGGWADTNVGEFLALYRANPTTDPDVEAYCARVVELAHQTLAGGFFDGWLDGLHRNEDGSIDDRYMFTASGTRWWWQRAAEITALAHHLGVDAGEDPAVARHRLMVTRRASTNG
jgi:hypothetical protein